MLLRADSFPRNHPTWDGKKVEDQTWSAWKEFFRPLQPALEGEITISSDQPDTFGTAAAARRYHGIEANHGFGKDAPGQPWSPDNLMAQLDCHFDNLASAATNNNSVLEQLETTTAEQYSEIKASLDALAASTPPVSQCTRSAAQLFGNTEKRKLERRIRTL